MGSGLDAHFVQDAILDAQSLRQAMLFLYSSAKVAWLGRSRTALQFSLEVFSFQKAVVLATPMSCRQPIGWFSLASIMRVPQARFLLSFTRSSTQGMLVTEPVFR